MRDVPRDRPYQPIGDVDAEWHGPSKAELRHQRESDAMRQAMAATPLSQPSPATLAKVATILQAATAHPPLEVMRWRIRLICGHLIEVTAHPEHRTLHEVFTGQPHDCPKCGQTDRVAVAARPLGIEANPRATPVRAAGRRPRPTLIVPIP
jgi:hypothetical protein